MKHRPPAPTLKHQGRQQMADTFKNWLSAERLHQVHLQRAGPNLGSVLASMARGEEREQILVVDILLAVGQLSELVVRIFEFRRRESEPKLIEAARERMPARVFAQHDVVRGHADRLGRHDFVAEGIREQAVLMYARLVREGVAADNGLVRLYAEADYLREELARRVKLFCLHTARGGQGVWPRAYTPHHLFARGVACALADAVDCAFDLTRARVERGEAIGDREP